MGLRSVVATFAMLVMAGCAAGDATDAPTIPPLPPAAASPSRIREPALQPAGMTALARLGNPDDDPIDAQGPALVLLGGESKVPSAFAWMHDVIAGDRRWAGDVVVLTSDGDDSYAAAILASAQFNSTQTVRILPSANDADFRDAAELVEYAEAVFLVGDDPATFARWRRNALGDAIQRAFDRGAVLGGTAAGATVLGDFAFAGKAPLDSKAAMTNPFQPTIQFTDHAYVIPPLEALIVEPHFRDGDRFGRLAAFMARQVADGTLASSPPRVFGIGVDEGAAALVDAFNRVQIAQNAGTAGSVFVIEGGVPDQIAPNEPLVYAGLTVTRLEAPGEIYDMGRRCGTAFRYAAGVHGDRAQPYEPANPYVAAGLPTACP